MSETPATPEPYGSGAEAPPQRCPRCWSPNPRAAAVCSECGLRFVPEVVPERTNVLAVTALVCGVCWVFGLGSLLAVILGAAALGQINASDGVERGRAAAITALFVGGVGLVMTVALVAPVFEPGSGF
jgi:hypothetical protein